MAGLGGGDSQDREESTAPDFEGAGDSVALGRWLENEKVIRAILQATTARVSLRDILQESLDILLETSWLRLENKGGIFLVGAAPETLELTVQRGLPQSLQSMCARVSFGHCMCGRAARSRRIVHASCIDDRHDNQYSGMAPHGHYNVPILGVGVVLGVIVLYLPEGYRRNIAEIFFLRTVANILSLVIQVKRNEDVLEQRVAARTAELAEAVSRAERASRAKTEFLSNISHEFRTPLNAIIGFGEMMRDEVMGPIGNDAYKAYIEAIGASGNDLRTLVENVIELSGIELGDIALRDEAVDVTAVIDPVVAKLADAATPARVALTVAVAEGLPTLRCDRERLESMLTHLVSNAVNFTPAGGIVRVSASRDGWGRVVVSVADTGEGIAADELALVTEPFFRSEGRFSRSHDGKGLGLTLVKRMVEAHGGELYIESEPGAGTRVELRFPSERAGGPPG